MLRPSENCAVGLMPEPTVHLHLTKKCNLECRHCYSNSSPFEKIEINTDECFKALKTLYTEGYSNIAFSGGEPFLHSDFLVIAELAKTIGYKTSVITNGIVFDEASLTAVSSYVDHIAVSIDGTEDQHNFIRRRKDAFKRSLDTLKKLRDRAIPFSLSCTVSSGRLNDAIEIYKLAVHEKAAALQFSPVLNVGRAEQESLKLGMSEDEKERLYLIANMLDHIKDGPRVRIELVPRDSFLAAAKQFSNIVELNRSLKLSSLVNPLVITESGSIVPFAYGVHESYNIGSIGDISKDLINSWKFSNRALALSDLVNRSFSASQIQKQRYIEWYADLVMLSQQHVLIPKPHFPIEHKSTVSSG